GVRQRPHLGQVETGDLGVGVGPHADGALQDVEEDDGHDAAEHDQHHDVGELGPQLAGVAVEDALHACRGTAVPPAAVGTVGEQADGEQAPQAVGAVHGDGTDRVVDLGHPLDQHHHTDDDG